MPVWQRGKMHDRPDFGDLSGYGWVYELVDVRPGVRAAALDRHRSLMGGTVADGRSGTLVDLVSAITRYSYDADAVSPQTFERLAPYGVLFLQWELRFPVEWRDGWPYSPWSAKEAVLNTFCVRGPTPQTGPALADLLIAAVGRTQRCQDRWYCRLARRIETPQLRTRLAAAAAGASEQTQLRARFVLWVLDHPDEGTGSAAWRRWLRSEGHPVTPASVPGRAGRPARP
jgi:hypothetical protein